MTIEDQCQAIMSTLDVSDAIDGYIVVTGDFEGRKFRAACSATSRPRLALDLAKRMVALGIMQAGSEIELDLDDAE